MKKSSLLGKVSSAVLIKIGMLTAAAALASAVVVPASFAAFSGTTANPGNTWSAGSVNLTNNKATAMFTASSIAPGYTESHCITVSTTSTIATVLSFYAVQGANTNGLADNLTLNVAAGSGGTDGASSCTGFVSAQSLYSGTMTGLSSAHGTAGTAFDVTTQLAASGSQQFMITATLPSSAPNTVQSGTAGMDFNWMNRNP
ncbi:MAG TPA: hypothetical protein VF867_16275 [Arthrobacter sp.]